MRVYQFRHIRAPADSSRRTPTGMLHGNRPSRIGVKPIMNRVLALLCAARPLLPRRGLRLAREATRAAARRGPSSEVDRHARVAARRGPHGASGRAARAAIDREQARFAAALHATIPTARIRWRYRLVLNGAAVVVPHERASAALPVAPRRAGGRRRAATYTGQQGHDGDVATAGRDLADGPRRTRAPASRSGSSTTASTRPTRTSPRPATRCRPASRRGRRPTRRRR